MTLHEQPLFTWEMSRDDLEMPSGAVYLHGESVTEERGDLNAEWVAQHSAAGVRFASVSNGTEKTRITDGATSFDVYLTDDNAIRGALTHFGSPLFLDVTALAHNVWAPLVRAAVLADLELYVVYLEPATYRRSSSPAPGLIFDLSEKIGGIAPLPGFARITGPSNDQSVFVPMLGFEGARFSFLLENVQAPLDKTFPIIGVPGFRAEYPFDAFAGNRLPLDGILGRRVHLAKANCPFDAFHSIHRIHRQFSDSTLKLAPIGTKPHALGAVLYALAHPADVELIYDHPVRSSKRTVGEARLCLYDITGFVASSLFLSEGQFESAA